MTVDITINQQHLDEYCSVAKNQTWHRKARSNRLPEFMIYSVVFLGIIMVTIGPNIPSDTIGVACIGAGIGFILGWVIIMSVGTMVEKRNNENFRPMQDDPIFLKKSYIFADGLLEWRNEVGGGYYTAGKLKRFFEDDRLILLFVSNREAYILPKDQLSQEQLHFIRNWASSHIKAE
jgi:hypothetical protein